MPHAPRAKGQLLAGVLAACVGWGHAAGWHTFEGHNCYEHHGGFRGDLGFNPGPKPITLEECRQQCEEKHECAGVLTIHRHSTPGQPPEGPCWLRKDVSPEQCFADSGSKPWDLHVLEGRGVDVSDVSTYSQRVVQASDEYSGYGERRGGGPAGWLQAALEAEWALPVLLVLLILVLLIICCLVGLVLREAKILPDVDDARRPVLVEADRHRTF